MCPKNDEAPALAGGGASGTAAAEDGNLKGDDTHNRDVKGTGAPADSDLRELYVRALKPITDRVRRDVTAIKLPSGTPWTDETLTKARLLAHLFEDKPRGCCPIKAGESTTLLGLLDLDSHNGETSWPDMASAAVLVMSELRRRGAAPIPFRSSGGRGIHIFVLYEKPQDAHSVRVFLDGAIRAVGYKNGAAGVKNRQMEIFPKQPTVEVGRYGNQFILPLAKQSVPLEPATCDPLSRDAVLTMQWPMSLDVPFVENAAQVREASSVGVDPGMAGRALLTIPNDGSFQHLDDRAAWFKLLCAFKEAAGEEGYTIANDWSAQHGSHAQEKFDKAWDSIQIGRENGAPAEYLYSVAGEFGFDEHIYADFDELNREALAEVMARLDAHDVVGGDVVADVQAMLGEKAVAASLAAEIIERAKETGGAAVAKQLADGLVVAIDPLDAMEYASEFTRLKPVEFTVDGFLSNGLTVIAGEPGVGKTSLLTPLAAVVAGLIDRGLDIALRRRVVYFSEDPQQVERILYGIARHVPGAASPDEFAKWFKVYESRRMSPETLAKVVQSAVKRHTTTTRNGYRVAPLLVLDTSNATLELENENDNSEVGRMASAIKRALSTGGCWLVTHTAKGMNRQDAEALTARGAGAFGGDANATAVIFKVPEMPDQRFMLLRKRRYEAEFIEMAFSTETHEEVVPTPWGTEQRVLYRIGVPRPSDSALRLEARQEARNEDKRMAEMVGLIRGYLERVDPAREGRSKSDLETKALTSGRNETKRNVINLMIAKGQLVVVGRGSRSNDLYSLPQEPSLAVSKDEGL